MFHHTTILSVRKGNSVVLAGDGQVTMQSTVVKAGGKKVRTLAGGKVIVGFAGGAADAFALLTRLEEKLEKHSGQLERAAVEMVRDWRTDRVLRRLEALMIACDKNRTLLLSGTGDLIEPDDGVVSVGSGSVAAASAARALVRHTELPPRDIAEHAMKLAADMDIYTNDRLTIEEL